MAIVTGAASGIGRSVAAHFLEEGFRVVGLDIRPPPPFDTNRWTGLSCDVGDDQAWATVMNGIVRDLGAPGGLSGQNTNGSGGQTRRAQFAMAPSV